MANNGWKAIGIALTISGLFLVSNVYALPFTTIISQAPTFFFNATYGGTITGGGTQLVNGGSSTVSTASGALYGYYRLQSSSVTIVSSSILYCSGAGCTPTTALVSTSGSDTSGTYITAASPNMVPGTPYTYRFTLTDSVGTSAAWVSTLTFSSTAATPTFNAYVTVASNPKTCIGTNTAGCTIVSTVTVNNVQVLVFEIDILSNENYVSTITVSCTLQGTSGGPCPFTSITLTTSSTTYPYVYTSGTYIFPTGTYTVSGVITTTFSSQVGAFSIVGNTIAGTICAFGCTPITYQQILGFILGGLGIVVLAVKREG